MHKEKKNQSFHWPPPRPHNHSKESSLKDRNKGRIWICTRLPARLEDEEQEKRGESGMEAETGGSLCK